jgi:hypothetical protein
MRTKRRDSQADKALLPQVERKVDSPMKSTKKRAVSKRSKTPSKDHVTKSRKAARQATPASKGKSKVNKAELVRSLPGVPAKEVVAVMAKKGVKVTESYVYNVRAMARASQKKAKKQAMGGFGFGPGASATRIKQFSIPNGPSRVHVEGMGGGGGGGGGGYTAPGPVTVEELLMAAAAEMGLSRAITLLYSAQTVITKALGVRA